MADDAPITLVQLNAALAPILTALGNITLTVTALDKRVTTLDGKVTALDGKVTALDKKVTALDEKVMALQFLQNNAAAKAFNGQIGRSEPLVRVPCRDGDIPDVEFPPTICHLLVSGNEQLPDGGNNTWNIRKSTALLAAFGDESDNDTDREDGPTSRRKRLKVAKVLGVTKAQLNFAQLTL